jgi:hypothetical protein
MPRPIASCTVLAALVVPLAAQAEPLLPQRADAHWSWRQTRHSPDGAPPVTTTVVALDEGGGTMPDGERVHQWQLTTDGAAPWFACWSLRADGLYRHPMQNTSVRGTIARDRPSARLVALPLGTADTWTWRGPDVTDDAAGDLAELEHHATLVATEAKITVGAGTFRAVHVRIDSERGGTAVGTHSLWFAPGVGLVREERHRGEERTVRELQTFKLPRTTPRDRLVAHLERELGRNPKFPVFHATPWIVWVDDLPEALLLPGRIAVAKAETWSKCFYVDEKAVIEFEPREADKVALAARAAFGTKTAAPPATLPLRSLALLLARTHAERCNLGRVRETAPTLQSERKPGVKGDTVNVEVIGGAPDGTDRRVAIWLTLARFSDVRIVTDAVVPHEPAITKR